MKHLLRTFRRPGLARFGSVVAMATLLLTLTLGMTGCEDKATLENFEQVREGMTLAQVEALLGSGTAEAPVSGVGISSGGIASSRASEERVYVWTSQYDGRFVVAFRDGVVARKQRMP